MKCISWNCRGLGNPAAVRALKKLLKSQNPDMVFLMETRLQKSDRKAKSSLLCGPLSNMFMIDCVVANGRRSGGLALIWNNVLNIDIIQSTKNLIDKYITSSNIDFSLYATRIYGFPYYSQKHLTCAAIKDIYHDRISACWLIFGDFNLLLNSSEKLGGNNIDYHHTNLFNENLNYCDLIDLGYQGSDFTWANNQTDSYHIKERIDRYCANPNCLHSFPRYNKKHLLRYTSDHNPIMLEFYSSNECYHQNRHHKIQRFEQIWANDQDSVQVVKNAWHNSMGDQPMKLKQTLQQIAN